MGGLAASGASAGAVAGGGVGLVGLAGGGVGVVVTEPAGLVAGGIGGGVSGMAAGMTVCPGGAAFSGNGGTSSGAPKGTRGNKQADAAKGQAERITGKKMTRDQEEIFHEETKHVDYSEGHVFDQLVQIAVGILR